MSTHRKLMTVCCAAVFALGLAACGSSDDSTMDTDPPMDMPTDAEKLAAAEMAVAAARTAVGALTGASTPSEIASAHNMLAHAMAQLATASEIPANQITLLQRELAKLQMQLTDLQKEIDDERMASANAQMAVDDAVTALAGAEMAATEAQAAHADAVTALEAAAAALAGATGADLEEAVVAYTDAQAAEEAAGAEAAAKQEEADTAATALETANAALAEIDPNHVDLVKARADLAVATKRAEDAEKKRDELQKIVTAAETAAEKAAEELAAKPGLDADAMALVAAINLVPASPVPGATVSPTTGAVTDKDYTATAEADLEISSIAGWQGSESVKETEAAETTPASTDTIVVYNNKEAPKPTPYGDVYNAANSAVTGSGYTIADGEITFTGTDEFSAMIMMAGFDELVNGAQKRFEGPDTTTTPAKTGEYAGTFHGVPGTYTCTETAGCTVSRSNEGNLTFVASNWTFTPDTGVHMVDVEDKDYMHIGYWMKTSTDKDGDPTAMIAGISGGTLPSLMAAGTDDAPGVQNTGLHGSATYAGAATGEYVRKELTADGDPEHLYHGQFTADAALTAYFGGPNVAANKHYSIDGTISDFKDGDGQDIDTTWSVTLNAAPFGVDNTGGATGIEAVNDTNRMFAGTTSSNDDPKGMASGNWTGQFFGEVVLPVMDDANTADVDETVAVAYPSGVAGTFDGHFTNGHVLGAFGADKE